MCLQEQMRFIKSFQSENGKEFHVIGEKKIFVGERFCIISILVTNELGDKLEKVRYKLILNISLFKKKKK